MELHHLYYVVTLAQELSFSRAADRLFITQPTLSQQIKNLEAELGYSLFSRSTKNVMLTSYGEQFVERAKRIIAEFEDLHKWSSQISELKNSKLSFGASAITTPHASACIPDFISQFPEVQFSYTEQWDPILVDMVREGSLDIALVDLPKKSVNSTELEGLQIYPICEEYVCVVVSKNHPLNDRRSVTLQSLANEQIVSTSMNSGLTQLMKREFALLGLNPHFSMNLISIEARLSVVKKGAITFVMNEQFKIYNNDDICVIPIEPKIYRVLSLVTAAGRKLSFFEKTFIQIIREGVAKRLAAGTISEQS